MLPPDQLYIIALLDKLSEGADKSNASDLYLYNLLRSGIGVGYSQHVTPASSTWTITHNKNNQVYTYIFTDDNFNRIVPMLTYADPADVTNRLIAEFPSPVAGWCFMIFGQITTSSTTFMSPNLDIMVDGTGGCVPGDLVYQTGVDHTVALASAVGTAFMPCVGAVANPPSAGMVQIRRIGLQTGYSGLIAGNQYFVSNITPGKVTSTAPFASGEVRQLVGIASAPDRLTLIPNPFYVIP